MKKKLVIFIIIQIFAILLIGNFSYAAGLTNPMESPGTYQPGGLENADQVKDLGNILIGIVQFIGSFASVIVLVVLGIKYMTGSVEEKAEYKKTMMPYLIGAILVFATTNILGIVNSLADGLF